MKELEDRIIADGQVIGNNILKVDAFLNHQIDPEFILRIGAELARRFKDEGVNKVLTVEASGIAVAMAAALALKAPVVFAKKKQALTQEGDVYAAPVFSFTRKEHLEITVARCFLSADDVVLIIDDFLAHGEALNGLISLVEQAGAKLAGAGSFNFVKHQALGVFQQMAVVLLKHKSLRDHFWPVQHAAVAEDG